MKPENPDESAGQRILKPSPPEVVENDLPSGPTPLAKRPNAGQFRKGHAGPRLTTGRYSDDHLPPGLEWLPAEVDRFEGAQLVDEGEDEGDVHSRRRKLIEYNARIIHKNIWKLAHALEARGLVDRRGKLRVAWLQQLGALIDKSVRITTLLGLERRQKPVADVSEWLAAQTPSTPESQP